MKNQGSIHANSSNDVMPVIVYLLSLARVGPTDCLSQSKKVAPVGALVLKHSVVVCPRSWKVI